MDNGVTINGEIHFSSVCKRGGVWGWFETTANTRVSNFRAYGHRTKRDAAKAREAAIAKTKGEAV